MSRIFIARQLPGPALAELSHEHDVDVWPHEEPPTPGQLIEHLRDADAAITLLTERIDAQVLEHCPRITVISNYAVGYDNIDIDAARAHSIQVGNTPDVLTDATADHAFALLLAAARHVIPAENDVRAGRWMTWEPAGYLGRPVADASLLIIGYGRIGRAVAQRARGFAMNVNSVDVDNTAELPALLGQADYVSLHCPLTPTTTHLIDDAAIARMKPTAILVNTARGPLVDTAALTRALRDGRIGGAGLDVTDPEPLPPDHPLLNTPNVVITPHIASATDVARAAMTQRAVANIRAGLAGRPLPYPVVAS